MWVWPLLTPPIPCVRFPQHLQWTIAIARSVKVGIAAGRCHPETNVATAAFSDPALRPTGAQDTSVHIYIYKLLGWCIVCHGWRYVADPLLQWYLLQWCCRTTLEAILGMPIINTPVARGRHISSTFSQHGCVG